MEDSRIVIAPAHRPRQGWEEAFATMHAAGADELLDEPTPTRFEEEWKWPERSARIAAEAAQAS